VLSLLQEQHALHYELYKNISLQHHVTLGQADDIATQKEKIVDLEQQLAEAQGMFPAKLAI
jgi:hypothetical protein